LLPFAKKLVGQFSFWRLGPGSGGKLGVSPFVLELNRIGFLLAARAWIWRRISLL
jgi:hypothetical protein